MNANDIIRDARVENVRTLKVEAGRLKAELASALNKLRTWESHFALAVLAARDAESLPSGGSFVIVDGWNFQLCARAIDAAVHGASSRSVVRGASSGGATRATATEAAQAYLAAHPLDFAWVVFDGSQENARLLPRLRISFTGGVGEHRADRLICDFIHALRMTGRDTPVIVVTDDRDFKDRAETLGARVISGVAFEKAGDV